MEKLDCIVAGAGVIGLAVARSLALSGREVVVLEAEKAIASHASSRNSEVIHAGIYYAENSLKARLCVAGKELLYRYCEEHGVPCRRLGKLIVATAENELPILRSYLQQARLNGVEDLRWLGANELARHEPAVCGVAGLVSPSTGIIDSHAYILALQAELEAAGGSVVCDSRVRGVASDSGGLVITVDDEPPFQVRCNTLINSAGPWAQQLAAAIAGFPASRIPELYLAKGHYYSYSGTCPFGGLVYPLATDAGLGIHATVDISGALRFGPDAHWAESVEYAFDDSGKKDFVAAVRKYYPDVSIDRLQPAYAGVRPKLSGPGGTAKDFVIQGSKDHGVPGLLNLFGMESPGLTASLAIGEYVLQMLNPKNQGDSN